MHLPWGALFDEIYEAGFSGIGYAVAEGITHMALGLFLEDVRDYRIRQLAGTGITPLFPLWGAAGDAGAGAHDDRVGPARGRHVHGPEADARGFCRTHVRRAVSEDLPASVDPCGERGEFHTFCTAGPMFNTSIEVEVGEVVTRDGFTFADVVSRR